VGLRPLEFYIRKRLPQPVRRLLRALRHSFVRGLPSHSVPTELFEDCRVCSSRSELVTKLPQESVVAEVGVLRGDFSQVILREGRPKALHLVDFDLSEIAPVVSQDPRVSMHRGDSAETLAAFPDSFFDWIYIDADHSYEGVRRDADVAARKVKPQGYLVFNDFAHIDQHLGAYGVHRAVSEFAVSHRWPFRWFSYDPQALYDVALQRPS